MYRVSFTYSGGSGASFTGLGFWSDATAVSSGLLGNIFYIQVAGGANLALGATLVYNDQRMITARFGHTATLLANGKVLLTGGAVNGPNQLFDPTSRAFTSTGGMIIGRKSHTATLLPTGKVLVLGGSDTNNQPLLSAEQYDPTTGTFSAATPLNQARSGHTATALANGKILVAGGTGTNGALASIELY
jgi:hypothetical protein